MFWGSGSTVLRCAVATAPLCSALLSSSLKKTHSQFWGQRSEVNPQTGFMSADR